MIGDDEKTGRRERSRALPSQVIGPDPVLDLDFDDFHNDDDAAPAWRGQ
jgi:hypothetical protein